MKKLKILISIVTVFIMTFAYTGVVKAADDEETITNIFEGATFEIFNKEESGTAVGVDVTNVNWNATDTKLYEYSRYYVYYSDKNNLTLDDLMEKKDDSSYIYNIDKENQKMVIDISEINNVVERTGDIYLYIVYNSHEYKQFEKENLSIVVKALKLERKPVANYTKIFPSWMMATYDVTQVGLNIVHSDKNSRKLQVKIGKIADESLLQRLSKNPEAAWDDLKSYAKNNTGLYDKVNDCLENLGFIQWYNRESIMDINSLEDGAYYYLYLRADSGNGEFIEYDGVTIAQAQVYNNSNSWYMFFYGDGKFAWKDFGGGEVPESNVIIVNDINGDMTTADKPIPQTGEHTATIIVALAALLGIGFVSYRRFKNTQIK